MRVKVQNDAMTQNAGRHSGHIFCAEMHAATHESQNAAAFDERLRATRRTAIANVAVGDIGRALHAGLRGHDHGDGVILHMRRHDHLTANAFELGNLRAAHDGLQSDFVVLGGDVHNPVEIFARRIFHQNLHQKAIQLRFGQRIGAFHLDRVLRGHHQKRRVQLVAGGAAGDGAFLHRFEQRRLRLWRSAVDFVGQDEIRKDRPLLESAGSCGHARRSP